MNQTLLLNTGRNEKNQCNSFACQDIYNSVSQISYEHEYLLYSWEHEKQNERVKAKRCGCTGREGLTSALGVAEGGDRGRSI